jgi:hypothetical protein
MLNPTHPTLDKLQMLRLTGMVKALTEQLSRSGIEELGLAERLGLLVDREMAERESRRLKDRLAKARLRHAAPARRDSHTSAQPRRRRGYLSLGVASLRPGWPPSPEQVAGFVGIHTCDPLAGPTSPGYPESPRTLADHLKKVRFTQQMQPRCPEVRASRAVAIRGRLLASCLNRSHHPARSLCHPQGHPGR